MPIRFVCPLGHPLLVPDELAGTDGHCPVCQQRVAIPVNEPAAPATNSIQPAEVLPGRVSQGPVAAALVSGSGAAVMGTAVVEHAADGRATRQIQPFAPPLALATQMPVYVAPRERIRGAYGMSIAFGVSAILGAWPALAELQHPPVSGWVWVVLGLSFVQAAYAMWLAGLPDWSTVWIGMALSIFLAALDAVGLAAVMVTPATRALPIGLDEVRSSLGGWSACLLLLHGGLAYAAGWISARWRHEYERAKAARAPRA